MSTSSNDWTYRSTEDTIVEARIPGQFDVRSPLTMTRGGDAIGLASPFQLSHAAPRLLASPGNSRHMPDTLSPGPSSFGDLSISLAQDFGLMAITPSLPTPFRLPLRDDAPMPSTQHAGAEHFGAQTTQRRNPPRAPRTGSLPLCSPDIYVPLSTPARHAGDFSRKSPSSLSSEAITFNLDIHIEPSINPWHFLGLSMKGSLSDTALMFNTVWRRPYMVKVFDMRHRERASSSVAQAIAAELRVHHLAGSNFVRDLIHSSPQIDRVFWCSDGLYYLAKESASCTLGQFRGKLNPDVLRQVIAQTLLGIAHLHDLGVIHTDIQPENIIVGEDGHCRIANFEHAHFIAPNDVIAHGDNYSARLPLCFNSMQAVQAVEVHTSKFSAPELRVKHFGRYVFGPAVCNHSLGVTIFALVVSSWDMHENDMDSEVLLHQLFVHISDPLLGCDPRLVDLVQAVCDPSVFRLFFVLINVAALRFAA
ncbi:hypothetical protein HGRIS_004800 [Hohenbuehelia grisea]|uniref:non-specific serine/threonine protein kinase n=1 Tax=Hohenbuehelia grisea TaxID=104357 RepID=A0ABR3JD79_9AGAR